MIRSDLLEGIDLSGARPT